VSSADGPAGPIRAPDRRTNASGTLERYPKCASCREALENECPTAQPCEVRRGQRVSGERSKHVSMVIKRWALAGLVRAMCARQQHGDALPVFSVRIAPARSRLQGSAVGGTSIAVQEVPAPARSVRRVC
jgi:hypothetical protein